MQEAIELGYLAVEADASSEAVLHARPASSARAASSPRSAPMPRTSTRCSPRDCCGPTSSSSAAPRPTTPRRSWCRAGADRVLSPYQIGGLQLAQTALRPAVVDFVQLATSSDNLDLNMEQVQHRARRAARRPDDRRGQPASAIRRRRRSASSGRTGAWSSIRRPTRHAGGRSPRRARPSGEPARAGGCGRRAPGATVGREAQSQNG